MDRSNAWQGRVHALLHRLRGEQRGQGTVEYIGLILLVAVILSGVVAAADKLTGEAIAEMVIKRLTAAIKDVGSEE